MENMPPQLPPQRASSQSNSSGCWKWGAISCVGCGLVSVIGIIVFFVVILNSPMGKGIMKSVGQIQTAQTNMGYIKKGIDQYKREKKAYPKTLDVLFPTYISDKKLLHVNNDPSLPMYKYHIPGETVTGSAVILETEVAPIMSGERPVPVRMFDDGTFEKNTITTNSGRTISLPTGNGR